MYGKMLVLTFEDNEDDMMKPHIIVDKYQRRSHSDVRYERASVEFQRSYD